MARQHFILPALLVLTLATAASSAEPYKVIVNDDNPVGSISKATLRDYFLGKATRWPHGPAVELIDLPETSPVREAFSKDILQKAVAAVKSHWLSAVFAGRGTPPVQLRTEEEVISTVRSSNQALGYVSASATLGPGVRAVPITN